MLRHSFLQERRLPQDLDNVGNDKKRIRDSEKAERKSEVVKRLFHGSPKSWVDTATTLTTAQADRTSRLRRFFREPVLYDTTKVVEAIGERSGARLQDFRRLDFVGARVTHGRNVLPAGAFADLCNGKAPAAP